MLFAAAFRVTYAMDFTGGGIARAMPMATEEFHMALGCGDHTEVGRGQARGALLPKRHAAAHAPCAGKAGSMPDVHEEAERVPSPLFNFRPSVAEGPLPGLRHGEPPEGLRGALRRDTPRHVQGRRGKDRDGSGEAWPASGSCEGGAGVASYVGVVMLFRSRLGWGVMACPETHRLYGKDILFQRKELPAPPLQVALEARLFFNVAHGRNGVLAVGLQRLEEDGDLASGSVLDAASAGFIAPEKKWRPV